MRFILIVLCLGAMATGCGRIPEPATYPYSEQRKMQAGHHWDVLAADVANEINNALIRSDYINTPVFVRETCGDDNTPCGIRTTSVFNETFRDLLITHLVNLGVPTRLEAGEEAIEIKYKAQQVYHQQDRLRTLRPGLLTSLTAGVIVFRHAPGDIAALATAGALDFANAAYNSTPHFEVVITTSMSVKERYLFRNTNIYYINDGDSWHYNPSVRAKDIALSAGETTAASRALPGEPLSPPLPGSGPDSPSFPESAEPSTGI